MRKLGFRPSLGLGLTALRTTCSALALKLMVWPYSLRLRSPGLAIRNVGLEVEILHRCVLCDFLFPSTVTYEFS